MTVVHVADKKVSMGMMIWLLLFVPRGNCTSFVHQPRPVNLPMIVTERRPDFFVLFLEGLSSRVPTDGPEWSRVDVAVLATSRACSDLLRAKDSLPCEELRALPIRENAKIWASAPHGTCTSQ